MKRIFAASLLVAVSSLIAFSQTPSRAEILNDIETKRAELAKLETQFLSPSRATGHRLDQASASRKV